MGVGERPTVWSIQEDEPTTPLPTIKRLGEISKKKISSPHHPPKQNTTHREYRDGSKLPTTHFPATEIRLLSSPPHTSSPFILAIKG